MRRHRRHGEEFKLAVVSDYIEDRVSLRELARRHGLGRNLILLWAEKYEPARLAEKRARRKELADYERKIAELESRITMLTIEVEMLRQRSFPMAAMPGADC